MAFNTAQGSKLGALVRQWLVDSHQGEPEGELLQFIVDIESASNVGIWAGVNYERILPFRAPLPRLVRILSIVRNALVFFPIVLTWLALEQAANSWASSGSDAGNFLQHWQGKEGLLSLRWVAWIDAFVIASLIVLTIVTGLLEESNKGRLALERQYQELMIAIERDLSGYRYLSLKDINNAASDTLNSLHGATQLVENAARAFADSSKEAHDAIAGANSVVHQTLAPAVAKLDSVIAGLTAAVGVHTEMTDLVKNVQADFAAQMSTLRQGVVDVLSAVDGRTSQILQNIDGQLSSAAQSLVASAKTTTDDVSRAMQSAANGMTQQVGQQLQGVSGNLNSALSGLNGLNDALEKTIASLNSTSNNVMINTATLADDLNQIHSLLQQTIQRLPR